MNETQLRELLFKMAEGNIGYVVNHQIVMDAIDRTVQFAFNKKYITNSIDGEVPNSWHCMNCGKEFATEGFMNAHDCIIADRICALCGRAIKAAIAHDCSSYYEH